ncbi:MAG: TRAP transporter substrate-binding protein [Spirochaetes bacterium]|nr:TRAP transporter substrate-binding protein [Spirochaetota bacterium]
MTKKKFGAAFCAAAVLSVALAFTSCGRDTGVTVIRVADIWSSSHPMARGVSEIFAPMIEAQTDGAIRVEVFHYGQLGNEQSLWDSVRSGAIDAVVVGTVMNSEYTPMLIADWPFLYRDLYHAKNVWTGSFAEQFKGDFNAFFPEVVMLSVGPNSARTFTSNLPLTSFADFQGQRIRMPANPIHTGIATDLGASAQIIPLSELFTALQTGVVDGQDNGMVTVLSERFNEVQAYLFETNHIVATMHIIMNSGALSRLNPEYQEIIRNAANAAAAFAWDEYILSGDINRQTLRDAGVIVTVPTPEDQQLLVNAVQPTIERLYAENAWARELTERVRNVQ